MKKKPYLLSVDNEELNQMLVEELFQADFDVGLVNNGQECLDSVEERCPDIILLDIDMPVLNGLETCKNLRSKSKYKDLLILAVSAMATPEDIDKGYCAGCNGYITKPYVLSELENKISDLLSAA